MPELYRLADHTHVNTQADAKHSGQAWEKVDVPTTRKELLSYLNEIAASCRGGISSDTPPAAEPQEPETAEVEYSQTHTPAPAPTIDHAAEKRRLVAEMASLSREEIVDRIFEAKPNDMAHYLLASVGRLGELGRDGWEHVQAHRHFCRDAERNQMKEKRPYAAAFDEKGLRYLCLMMIDDLNRQG
jgi:hypothetical protein